MFREEGVDGTKDIGDVGQSWGPTAEEQELTLKYKTELLGRDPLTGPRTTTATGSWATTAQSPSCPTDSTVPSAPTSFQDLLDGDYNVCVGGRHGGGRGAVRGARRGLRAPAAGIDDMQPATTS